MRAVLALLQPWFAAATVFYAPPCLCLGPRALVLHQGAGVGLDGLRFPNYVPQDPWVPSCLQQGLHPCLCCVLCLFVGFGESFLLLKKDLKTASGWILSVVPAHTNHESSASDHGGHVAFFVAESRVRTQTLSTSCFPGEKASSAAVASSQTFPVWAAPPQAARGYTHRPPAGGSVS